MVSLMEILVFAEQC